MKRTLAVIVVAIALLGLRADCANGQVELLDTWNWVPAETGSQPWQDGNNWVESGFPDNPGYVDADDMTIMNSTGANLSVGLGSNLTVTIQSPNVTVASLRMGGTAGAVTTEIAGPGMLVFENYESNVPDGADEDNDPDAYAFNRGNAAIVSAGTVGATNTISANVLINKEGVHVGSDGTNSSTNDLTITGDMTIAGGPADGTTTPSLTSFMPSGLELEIAGTLTIPDNNPHAEGEPIAFDFNLNTGENPLQGERGTINVTGTLAGDGHFFMGGPTLLPTANTISGRVHFSPGTIELGNNASFGTAQIVSAGGTLTSTDDARVIANEIGMSSNINVAGDHSIEFSGELQMTNSRSWVNNLPLGKELVLSGSQYIEDEQEREHYNFHEYALRGDGKTVVTGVVANNPDNPTWHGSVSKQGSGALFMQGSLTGNDVQYTGYTEVHGGTLHLASINDISQNSLPRSAVASRAGGIGLEDGTLSGPGSSTFLGLFNNRDSAYTWLYGAVPSGGGSFQIFGDDMQSFDAYDHGGLMLAADEYDDPVDFSSGALANVRDMSLAARERGTTTQFTSTLTPYQDTYRLGGGGGTLELPNANQLTNNGGNRNLVVSNGADTESGEGFGRVLLSNANNYSGTTRVEGEYVARDQGTAYRGTTLAVTSLANGGQDSSIGNSSAAASNVIIQGGTLQYVGSTNATTDRLLTLGTQGGGLDSSGTGTVSFTSTGAIALDFAGQRTGDTVGNSWAPTEQTTNQNNWVADIGDTSDLVPGMTIQADGIVPDPEDDDSVVTIIEVASPTRVRISDGGYRDLPATAYNDTLLTFGTVDRDFTLSGSNTGDNTFAPLLADSATTGDVNVVKEGAGKWILTNPNNDYSGNTIVEAGTLSITSPFLNDNADVELFTDAIFDLDFSGTDDISMLLFDGTAQPLGTWGAIGSGAANEREWFTGAGILNVMDTVIIPLDGDFNGDGIVNLADYTVWRDNLGDAAEDALNGNGDGMNGIDAGDYALWKTNFGATAAAAASLSIASAAVPEPSAIAHFADWLGAAGAPQAEVTRSTRAVGRAPRTAMGQHRGAGLFLPPSFLGIWASGSNATWATQWQ